jgi:phosphatidylserine/phosphatidylglycerophosphate/cardiolipin synthase-like enzyme
MTIQAFIKRAFLMFVFCFIITMFAAAAYVLYKSENYETYLTSILLDEHNHIHKAFFSPDDDVKEILVGLINMEKKHIRCAIYMLTEKEIAQAFINAHKRGVILEFVVDRAYASDKFSKVSQLANNQLSVWVYQTSVDETNGSIMHDKFCIFEENIAHKSILWTGSYNFTRRASSSNQENVVVLDDHELIERFKAQFEILKKRSLPISGFAPHYYKKYEPKENTYWWEPLWKFINSGK